MIISTTARVSGILPLERSTLGLRRGQICLRAEFDYNNLSLERVEETTINISCWKTILVDHVRRREVPTGEDDE